MALLRAFVVWWAYAGLMERWGEINFLLLSVRRKAHWVCCRKIGVEASKMQRFDGLEGCFFVFARFLPPLLGFKTAVSALIFPVSDGDFPIFYSIFALKLTTSEGHSDYFAGRKWSFFRPWFPENGRRLWHLANEELSPPV